jgi:lipoprotein-anchoring transpeptidase ErfK/SrfK
MMRSLLAATVAATLLFVAAPSPSYAAKAEVTAADLIVQKKKLAAEVKALEAQKAALQKSLQKPKLAKPTIVKTAAIKPVAAKPIKIAIKKTPVQQPMIRVKEAHLSPCGSFIQCVFGHKRRDVRIQQASFVQAPKKNVPNRTTMEEIDWNETKYPEGAIIVRTPERALYFVEGNGKALRYSVGVGREGMQWSGQSSIVAKAEWPSWNPPAEMIKREALKGHMLPDHMDGGPTNPLGARAMYIGGRIYRVHGTNNESSIGGAVSSGCIRMMNADVIDLYDRVKIGAKIYVIQ